MANGSMLDDRLEQPLLPSVNPMSQPAAMQQMAAPQAARQQGLAGMMGGAPGGAPSYGFGAGMQPGMGRLTELYGLMAQGADDPSQIGRHYVNAMQQQQQLDAARSPINKFLQIYGNVNPHDWSAESLQRFHNNYVQNGTLQFDLLEPKKTMSKETEKKIFAAIEAADTAASTAMNAGELAGRFEQQAQRGGYNQGALAAVDQWLSENITGNYSDLNDMRKQFKALRLRNVLKSLPPGVASDRDVRIAFEAFPSGYEDPAYTAAYLRGMQKLQIYEYVRQQHRAEWWQQEKGPAGTLEDWKQNADEYVMQAMDAMGVTLYNNDYFGRPVNEISGREAARFIAQQRGFGQTYGAGGTTLQSTGAVPGTSTLPPIPKYPVGQLPAQQQQPPMPTPVQAPQQQRQMPSREEQARMLQDALRSRGIVQ